MRISDDELDAQETETSKRLKELGPKRQVLGVANGDAQHLARSVDSDPRRHDDRAVDDTSRDAGLHVGGVKEDGGKRQAGLRAFAKRRISSLSDA